MTVLIGLASRLRLTRLVVRLGPQAVFSSSSVLPMLGRQGAVVLDPGLDHPPAKPAAVEDAWRALSGRGVGRSPLCGLWLDAGSRDAEAWTRLATRLQPDLIVSGGLTPGWPHPWVQRGAAVTVTGAGTVAAQMARVTSSGVDFVLVGAASADDDIASLVRQVVAWGGPENPAGVPWFWSAGSLEEAQAALVAGAVRLCLTAPDAALVEQCDRLTGLSWQSPAMRGYTLAALRPGRAGGAVASGWDEPVSLPPLGPAGRTQRAAKRLPARKGRASTGPVDAEPGQLGQTGAAG